MTSLGALLAMVGVVHGAFVTAGLADVRADSAKRLRVFTAPCHRTGCKLADGGAVHIEGNATRHHFDIRFLKTSSRAVVASYCAVETSFDTGCVLLMGHCDLLGYVGAATSDATPFRNKRTQLGGVRARIPEQHLPCLRILAWRVNVSVTLTSGGPEDTPPSQVSMPNRCTHFATSMEVTTSAPSVLLAAKRTLSPAFTFSSMAGSLT